MAQRPLRLLVVEGNTTETCDRIRKITGKTLSDAYGDVLLRYAPEATVDVCFPAFAGANLPDPAGLESYDGIAITGSALNVYDRGPTIDPQIELARAIYRAKVPFFGSCWGLQVASVAAGGEVRRNSKGRELGIARKITLTGFGSSHKLHAGRPVIFDAPCVHLDEVGINPEGLTVTAYNDVSDVQAGEIRHEGGLFWGVQYHPEFSLLDLAGVLMRYGPVLWNEGFFPGEGEAAGFIEDLRALHADPVGRWDLAWRYGIGREILDTDLRQTEIANWVEHHVRPMQSLRGRA
ncbi:MAG TPA: type 1 glutamine amidotransferase [Geminicoccus sp.]|uniref:type 1 glutamine amidotransferase n=1 Tax=Geminicoccus sp. TaxID=2024832 RepID=UPI002E2F6FAC|nr:type 1 glutamine amidotransferase [Geminicoccus sp.]HEX2528997.1 type 1 glutamine amidotransferase [Geminicoccus sp.]